MEYQDKNYTYILRCKDNTLYTGWTKDLDKRLKAHNEGKGAKYTRVRRPVELAYYETFGTKEEAMRREWEIKQMTRKRKEELIQRKTEFVFRPCVMEDLDEVMALQQRISDGMEQKDWFAETSREENMRFLKAPNLLLGVYDMERLIAYGSVGFMEEDAENLGWDLEWEKEKVLQCANLDTIVVDPEYRGRGLQRELIDRCIDRAREEKLGGTVLTTICPENIYSMRNAQAAGFEILLRTEKYGGKDRYILGKPLD